MRGTAYFGTCFLVCAAVLFLGGCAKERFADHIARGERYLAAGELGKANVEFRNALQIQPKDPKALYLDGYVCEQRGEVREAVALYQAALEVAPDDVRARARLARLLVLAGAAQQAVAVTKPGLGRHPDDPDLLAARAAARHRLGNDSGGREDAEHAVRVAPANEDAVDVLAAFYTEAGELPRAVALVSAAVARAPSSVMLHQLLVQLYLKSSQPEQAEAQLRQVIALEPHELGARLQLAAFLAHDGKTDAVQRVLEEAVSALPQSDAAKLALVDFIAAERSRAQGEQALRTFIAHDPDNAQLRLGLAARLQRAGATDEAIATYTDIVRRAGRNPEGLLARDRIAALEIVRGNSAAAEELIAAGLEENSRDHDALMLRANLAFTRGDAAAAIADLRAVLQDDPHSIAVERALAQAYLANGEPALAQTTLRPAPA